MTAANTPDQSMLSTTVFEKVGRNIFYLQKIEGMLKTLVAHSDVSSVVSDLPELFKRLREPVSMKTMGGLVTEFFEKLYSEVPDPKRPGDTEGSWIAFGFRFGSSKEEMGAMELLPSILSERNKFIHHVLPFFNLESDAARKELAASMDDQFVRIESVYRSLRDHIKFVNDMKSQLPAIMRQVIENQRIESQDETGVQDRVQPNDA